ncbi:MAG: hypothetical protein ACWGHH_00510 [Sulfurovaceae bacterium]
MENLSYTIGIISLFYLLYFTYNNQMKLNKKINDINEKIESLAEIVERAKQDIELQLNLLEEDLVPDDIKINNLVKMGFDPNDAWEYVTLGTVGGESPHKK